MDFSITSTRGVQRTASIERSSGSLRSHARPFAYFAGNRAVCPRTTRITQNRGAKPFNSEHPRVHSKKSHFASVRVFRGQPSSLPANHANHAKPGSKAIQFGTSQDPFQ